MMPYDEQTNGAPYMTTDSPSPPQTTSDAKISDNECTGDEANKHSSSNSEDVSDPNIFRAKSGDTSVSALLVDVLILLFGSFFGLPIRCQQAR